MTPGEKIVLDCRDDDCPIPVLRTKEALKTLAPGVLLEVVTKDPMAPVDIPAAVHKAGAVLVSMKEDQESEISTFLIRRE
jgi:tRNA 2-thiouridine synthesizing protein A